ncbi:uncharacterized protein A4U43_C05F29700 [Asparagus officinalis]|uniref:Uncharacterized protein n=1 Tax=Asparagus officinalis TaxID=4686 RepID=A0A5P1EXX7_ASPOF|nr:uncharacterized protein A4U43_C05F29700 [Asparagus officinalis]
MEGYKSLSLNEAGPDPRGSFSVAAIKEILVTDPKSGVILFDIRMAHKQLSVTIFENPPDCKEDGGLIPDASCTRVDCKGPS